MRHVPLDVVNQLAEVLTLRGVAVAARSGEEAGDRFAAVAEGARQLAQMVRPQCRPLGKHRAVIRTCSAHIA